MSAKATTATPQSTAKTPAAATPAASAAETQAAERSLGNRGLGQLRNSVQISRPNDADEREADRVAAQVMARTFDGEVTQRPMRLQRKCKSCEDEEPRIRRKAAAEPAPRASLQSRLDGSRDRGRPLSGDVLNSMGSAFGADLSRVRIHTGDYAAGLSEELGAQAFTYGPDIYFNRGKFDPGSMAGRHLLAHELTHTLQQDGMIRLKPQCLMTDWFEEIDKQIGGKRWGTTKEEKEEVRKRVRGLPDANKLKVREMIDECIREGAALRNEMAEGAVWRDKAKLPAHRKKVQDLCDTGVKNIRDFRRKAGSTVLQERGDELDKREQLLLILKQAMNDDKIVATDLETIGIDGNDSASVGIIKQLSEAPRKIRVEEIDLFIYLFSLAVSHGFGGHALGMEGWSIYSNYFSFMPSDLRTDKDKPDATAAPGGGISPNTQPTPPAGGAPTTTPPATGTTSPPPAPDSTLSPPDPEELAKIREFLHLLEKADLPGEHADMEALAKLLKDLSKEDLEAFKEFYKEYVVKHDEEKEGALTVEKALEKFLAMSELDRETLRTNRALKEKDETAPGPTAERIKLCEDKTDEAQQSFEELNKQLEKVQNMPGGDAGRKGEFAPLDGSVLAFLDEMSLLDGLIDGASRKSTDIADAAAGFWSELDRFRNNLITEMQWLAAQIAIETAAGVLLSYISLGTAAPAIIIRIGLLVKRLNNLRKLIQRAQRIIAIFDTFTEIIDAVGAAGQAYETFNREFDDGLRRLKVMQQRMDSLAGDENLDEEYEQLQEELMEKIQAQLDGNLGDLLQHFFIPPDTSEDELLMILTDIPAGIDSLKRVYERYQRGKGKASAGEFAQTLYVMATEAGFKLYPLVGFLTAKAGEALNSFNAELEGKSTADRMAAGLDRLVTKSRSHRGKSAADRKSGIRGLFEKIRPKRYDYNETDIKAVLKKGEEWMNTEFDKMNKDADNTESFNGFWTKALFRFTVRNKVKELNAVRSTFGDVRATLKGKKKDAANPEMRVTPPKFKVKWSSMFSRDKNFYFYLTLNPTSGKIPKTLAKPLSYTSFKGKGIPFTSKNPKKKDALHDWLDEEGYVITPNVKSRDFVRHSSRGVGPYGKAWYLQVDHDESTPRIKQDQKLTVTQRYIPDFYGRLVSDDKDLPEGYVLYASGDSEGIRARKGAALLLKKFPLGLDADGKIVGEDKKYPIVETKTEKKEETFENIVNPESMADKMFEADKVTPNPEYNVKEQPYEWWRKHIRRQGELQQRPVYKHYILGNVKYARSVGDLLGSRYLPELKYGDDRGHLIAKRFGGSDDYDNLIPMKSALNRGNQAGSWYRMEGDMAKEFRRGRKKVEVKINIEYPSPKSRRPHRFHGTFDVLKYDTSAKTWQKESSGSLPKGLKQ